MSRKWLIGGIFAALVAAFAGGCGLIFFAASMNDYMAGRTTYGVEVIALLVGVVPGIIAGLIAWWAFKKHRQQTVDED